MQVEGQYTINAPIERVWAYLQDPAGLQACIPGCEKLEPRGEEVLAQISQNNLGKLASLSRSLRRMITLLRKLESAQNGRVDS